MTNVPVSLPFHRQYRPRSFDDLVGHGSVKDVVRGALASEDLNGCLLFHGPYGVGKTSLVRLTAASVLCTGEREGPNPCGECASCVEVFSGSAEALDYREADCGNNTGADDARGLVQWLGQHPVRGTRRVIALDEVHKLSNSAASVLLKILEEPPAHVLFLLATTDPEKVLPTIRSRAISLQLRPLSAEDIRSRLLHVSEAEGVQASEEVLREIALASGGHLRDALQELQRLSLLDRPVDLDDVWASSAKLPPRLAGRLTKAVVERDALAVLEQARALLADGLLPLSVVLGLEQLFRDLFLMSQVERVDHLVSLPPSLLPKFKMLSGLVPPNQWRDYLRTTELAAKRLSVHTGREALVLDLLLLDLVRSTGVPLEAEPPVAAPSPTKRTPKARVVPVQEPPEIPNEPAPRAKAPEINSDVSALIGCLRNRNHQRCLKQAVSFEIGSAVVTVSPASARHREVLNEATEEISEAFTAMLQRPVVLELV